MISNDVLQETIVTFLKGKANLTVYLSSSGEIKEDQWKGSNFVYPAIRVQLINQTPPPNRQCTYSILEFWVLCFTEDASSQNCDEIAGVVNNILHDHQIYGTKTFFSIMNIGLVPATSQGERVWQSVVKFRSLVK